MTCYIKIYTYYTTTSLRVSYIERVPGGSREPLTKLRPALETQGLANAFLPAAVFCRALNKWGRVPKRAVVSYTSTVLCPLDYAAVSIPEVLCCFRTGTFRVLLGGETHGVTIFSTRASTFQPMQRTWRNMPRAAACLSGHSVFCVLQPLSASPCHQ